MTFFNIKSDNEVLLKKLKDYYGDLITDNIEINIENTVFIEYYKNDLTITKSNQVSDSISSKNIEIIFSKILREIRNKIELKEGYNLYHASCVKIGEKVFMFVGESTSGKTTLTAYLSALNNTTILSEDITMVNYFTGEVVPLLRPLLIRNDSYQLLVNEYNLSFSETKLIRYNGGERVVVTKPKDNIKLKNSYSLNAILFLHLSPKNITITNNNSFEDLLLHSYSSANIEKNLCSALHLYKRTPLYNLYYYDLRKAYENIKTL